jgi:hypothetical protein
MPYKPTPIETDRQRFEKAFWPAYFDQQTRLALADKQAELEAGLAPGGRLRVEAMDPRFRKAELAAQAAATAQRYADIAAENRALDMKQAMLGPQMENLQARSINQLSSARERQRRTDLQYARFEPEMENLAARTAWIGEQKPAIEWDRNALGWAKLRQANDQFRETQKLSWSKARKKGAGKSQEEKFADAFDTFLGDIAKGSVHYGLDEKGGYVAQSILTPGEIKKGELSATRVMQEFDRLPQEVKSGIWMQTLDAMGYAPLVESVKTRIARGEKVDIATELPSMRALTLEAARGAGAPKAETLKEGVAPATVGEPGADRLEREEMEKERQRRTAEYEKRKKRKRQLESDIYALQKQMEREEKRGTVLSRFGMGGGVSPLDIQRLNKMQLELDQLEGIDASGLNGGF